MISYSTHILDNGLSLLLHEDADTPLVTINILYKVGARNENAQRTGFAHLFEHLMFGGTRAVPDYDRVVNRLGGGVIVSSDLLKEHIRKNYPNIELHASVILTAYEEKRDTAYYEGLSRSYSRYVVHPDDNFEPDLLKTLPKERAEIILNERCVYQCGQRGEHYLANSADQSAILDGTGEFTGFLDRCPFVPDFKQGATCRRNISLSAEEAVKLSQLGFDLFKLQGRLDIPYVFFFDFLRYTLENQIAFPAVYPVFCFNIRNYLKEKERARRKNREGGSAHG